MKGIDTWCDATNPQARSDPVEGRTGESKKTPSTKGLSASGWEQESGGAVWEVRVTKDENMDSRRHSPRFEGAIRAIGDD